VSASTVLLLALVPLAARSQGADVRQALERGAFEEAHALVLATDDPLERARGAAEVFHRARDPLRALEAAEAGLQAAPEDLLLLYRAAAAALWLGLPAPAKAYAGRLARAVEGAELSPDERPAWARAAEEFAADAEDLARAEEARAAAVRRARWVVGLAGGVGLAAFVSLLVRAARGTALPRG
jgi:hypothetical protein